MTDTQNEPHDEVALLAYINATPGLLSILYDFGLMPEQVVRGTTSYDAMRLATLTYQAALSHAAQAKQAWISVKDRLPEFLPGKDITANVFAQLSNGSLVVANRYYEQNEGWMWAVASFYSDIRTAEPECDDDYEVEFWMPIFAAAPKETTK